MNDKNLIPSNKRTKKEARENGRKGGIKSGEVRREKKTLKDTLKMLLELPIKDKSKIKALTDIGIEEKDMTWKTSVCLSTIKTADSLQKGNSKALDIIAGIIGEKVTKVEVSGDTSPVIEEIDKLLDKKE